MKIFGTIVVALALSVASFVCLAEERKLKLAAPEWPPYVGEDLENGGFMTEIVVEALKRTGYDAEIKFVPWKRAIEGNKVGKYDGMYTIWYRKEREEWSVFSDPLPPSEVVFYKRKDRDISFETFEDLRPYTIGLVRGYAVPPGFDEASLKTSLANDDTENIRKLHKGRVDLAMTDKFVGEFIINTQLPEAALDLEWLDPPLQVEVQYLVLSKNSYDYAARLVAFNRGLAEIKADGTLQAIMAKHGF